MKRQLWFEREAEKNQTLSHLGQLIKNTFRDSAYGNAIQHMSCHEILGHPDTPPLTRYIIECVMNTPIDTTSR